MPEQCCDDVHSDSDTRAIFYMHMVLMIVYVVIAALSTIMVLAGLYISHRQTVKAIRSNNVKCTHAIHTQDQGTMAENSEQSRAPNTIIYLTRAGSVYHTNPSCDQGGNFAPMCAKRQCMICKAASGQRG